MIVHGEEVGDRIVGIMGGYIRWAGLVDDDTQAITVTERLAGRQLDPFARNVILDPSCADAAALISRCLQRGRARRTTAIAVLPHERAERPSSGPDRRVRRPGASVRWRPDGGCWSAGWAVTSARSSPRCSRRRTVGRRAGRHRRRSAAAATAPRRRSTASRPIEHDRIVEMVTAFNPHVVVHIAVWEPHSRANPTIARQLTDDAATSMLGAAAECRALETIVVRSGIEIYGRAHGAR